jgi:hypothetical protein
MSLLKFLGEHYYIDIDELESQVSMVNSKTPIFSGESENEQQISVTRYDTFKNLIDVVLTEREEIDDSLGIHGAKDLSIPFKISFNTLLINKIIKTL